MFGRRLVFKFSFVLSLAIVVCVLLLEQNSQAENAKTSKMNVVLIVSDDAGWADFGFQGSTVISTPQLDRLADRGVRFSNAYAGSVCSPSRAALVSGYYNSRIGYETNIVDSDYVIGTAPTIGFSPGQKTMFHRMGELGYTTGVVGKWHLGLHPDNVQNGILFRRGNQPPRMGADEFHGLLGGSRSYWGGKEKGASELIHQTLGAAEIIQSESAEQDIEGRYVTDVLGDWSVDFIKAHHKDKKPFFLYSSFTAPHTPNEAKKEDLARVDKMANGLIGKRRVYAAMMLALDDQVGRILQAIRDPNGDLDESDSIEDNTLIIFVNDNGGDCDDSNPNGSSNGILRGGKGSSWEGGFRVPMIVADPKDKQPHGTTFEHPVHLIDVLPTMLSVADSGAELDPSLDGVDLLPFLRGQSKGQPHKHLYLRRGPQKQCAVRMDDWKLYHHRKTGFLLFDLATNPSENVALDLADKHPEVVSKMKRIMTDYDVQMRRPAWKVENETTLFRFCESLPKEPKWSTKGIWSDEQFQSGAVTLTEWDGFANTGLVFRAANRGEHVSENDMVRQSGLPFMVNYLQFRTRESRIKKDTKLIISGNPLLLTKNLNDVSARIGFNSFSSDNVRVEFDIQLRIDAYSDFSLSGYGTDIYRMSGGLNEFDRPIAVAKLGSCTVILDAPSKLTGTIEVTDGTLVVANPQALGKAEVVVRQGATLKCLVKLDDSTKGRISGPGAIEFAK